MGFVDEIPHYAKPVDKEQEAETRRLQRDEAAYNAYLKRTADPRFEEIRGRMIEKAYGLEQADQERLDTDHAAFTKAYDSMRRDEVEARHRSRLEAIRERQHSSNAMERHRADEDIMEEHERHRAAVDAIESANYEALEEEPGGEND